MANQTLIVDIHTYINQIISGEMRASKKELETCILEVIKLFVSLPWPEGLSINKNEVIIQFLTKECWKSVSCEKKALNAILDKLEITSESI